MFNPLMWLDGAVLRTTQSLCDGIETFTGLMLWRIEKWMLIIAWGFWMANIGQGLRFDVTDTVYVFANSGLILAMIALTLFAGGFIWMLDTGEQAYAKNPSPRKRSEQSTVRIFFSVTYLLLGLNHLLQEEIIGFAADSILSALLYVHSCVPGPPRKSKVRKWWDEIAV